MIQHCYHLQKMFYHYIIAVIQNYSSYHDLRNVLLIYQTGIVFNASPLYIIGLAGRQTPRPLQSASEWNGKQIQ